MPEHRDPWTTFAGSRPGPRLSNAAGETTWFNWTQYPDHGPGPELLGEPRTVIDLGCGSGRDTTHLAVRGARVDFSPVLIGEAVSAGAAYRECALWSWVRWTSWRRPTSASTPMSAGLVSSLVRTRIVYALADGLLLLALVAPLQGRIRPYAGIRCRARRDGAFRRGPTRRLIRRPKAADHGSPDTTDSPVALKGAACTTAHPAPISINQPTNKGSLA